MGDERSTLFHYLTVLRARYRIALFILGVTVLTTTIVVLVMPRTYVATATLLVDPMNQQTISTVVSPRPDSGNQTQVDIITSQRVARRVVEDLKLAESPVAIKDFQKTTGGRGTIEDWLAESLLKHLKVDASSQTSVLPVSFSATDPQFAAAVANAFAKAYVDTNLELLVEPSRQTSEWFDDQLKTLRTNLEDAQAKLTDYQKKNGIVSADERYDIENARLNELSTQLVQAQEQTYGNETRQRMGAQIVAKGGSLEDFPAVLQDPFIQSLKQQLLQGEAKLKELSTQFGPNHPEYQRQLSENQSLRARLNQEMKTVVSSLRGSTTQSEGQEADLKNAIDAQREKLFALRSGRDQVAVLAGEVEAAQRAYDTAMQRFTTAKVDSRANQTNVSILTSAVEPIDAAHPKIGLDIALSLLIGAILGVGTVFLMEAADGRVRSVGDLERIGVPVLIVLRRRPRVNIIKNAMFPRLRDRTSRLLNLNQSLP